MKYKNWIIPIVCAVACATVLLWGYKEHTEQVESLTEAISELETDLAEAHTNNAALDDENMGLKDSVGKLKEENNSIKADRDKLKKRLDSLKILPYNYAYVVGVVAAEAGHRSLENQMAVAQCIKERSDAWGMNPEQVVKQKNQFAKPMAASKVPESAWTACNEVILGGKKVTPEPIKWFYSTTSDFYSAGHEKRDYVMTIQEHRFFK